MMQNYLYTFDILKAYMSNYISTLFKMLQRHSISLKINLRPLPFYHHACHTEFNNCHFFSFTHLISSILAFLLLVQPTKASLQTVYMGIPA